MDHSKMKIVYVITPRNGKQYWNRIGVAFVNSDGSLNVRLEAVPVSGEMQIRDYVPREDAVSAPARSQPRAANGNGAVESYAQLA
jgi:hypothetical protein